ncbi:cystathionine gamma-lyase-like isoform X2 [Latimeria chalumnae]|uniref:cystathionine gamma-lyase-like isoform X2 n=1 Tax=Latimeria chalumnae TaxID=7897 RepID=UPI00313B56EB
MASKEAIQLTQGYLPPPPQFTTNAIHYGQEPEQWQSMSITPMISTSAVYKQISPGKNHGYIYTRMDNPSRHGLEQVVGKLDGAKYSIAVSSGMAAVAVIAHLLKTGDHILVEENIYGGTYHYFNDFCKKMGTQISDADFTNPSEVIKKLCQNTKRPLELGADIAMCAGTKYINGHSDVLIGFISMNRDDLHKELRKLQGSIGAVPSPFDCFLCNRGLKTLELRMKRHFQNAMEVALFLQSYPGVQNILYPGLPSHPQYELMKKQCGGCSGVISFFIEGDGNTASVFLQNLRMISIAVSFGGYESVAEQPIKMFPKSDDSNEIDFRLHYVFRGQMPMLPNLIRLAVGLEDVKDIIADLQQALDNALRVGSKKGK